jgi:hypothetical protein
VTNKSELYSLNVPGYKVIVLSNDEKIEVKDKEKLTNRDEVNYCSHSLNVINKSKPYSIIIPGYEVTFVENKFNNDENIKTKDKGKKEKLTNG